MAAREIRPAKPGRVLDEVTRDRRQKKALEALEQDNFQEEPYSGLGTKKGPLLEPEKQAEGQLTTKKKVRSAEYFRNKYRKSFQQLLDEEQVLNPDGPNYSTAEAPPSSLPKRHFCAVCGFPSSYTCVQCGVKYCQPKCLSTHQDTRCMKYTV